MGYISPVSPLPRLLFVQTSGTGILVKICKTEAEFSNSMTVIKQKRNHDIKGMDTFVGKMNPNRIVSNLIRSNAECSKNPRVRTYIFPG